MIRNRRLLHLPSLQHISHSLENLTIAFSDYITSSAGYLSHCRVLKRLSFFGTSLTDLSLGLRDVADTVIFLNFRGNKLTSLSEMHCIHFPKLAELDLIKNYISYISARELLFPSLQKLHLHYNRITYIEDPSPFGWGSGLPKGSFTNVHIFMNPWNCSKSFSWLTQGVLPGYHPVFVSYRRRLTRS